MPKSASPPKYRHYKPRNLAVVRLSGRDHYLGTYGSPESKEAYARLIAEFIASGTTAATSKAAPPLPLTVTELCVSH